MTPIKESPNSLPVLVSGYYGFDNLGDEAILESIIQWFDKRDDTHPVVLSAIPTDTFDRYGVDSIRRADLFAILKRIPGSPVLLQGGGGLLQDSTSFRSLMYYLGILFLGFIAGRRVAVFGQGIGPLEAEISPLLVGELLGQCDLVAVRDFKSFSFCQNRLPLNANLVLMADAALLLEPAEPDIVEDVFLQENLDLPGRPLVAFCVKGPKSDRRQLTALARAIDMTMEQLGGGVVLIPFHHPDDVEYAELVRSLTSEKDDVMVMKGKYRPAEMLGVIGKCDIVVGMRLHSLIFAANRGVPFVAVSYDPKVDEFAGEFGFKPAAHTPLVGPEMLFDAIADTYELRGRMKTKITETTSRLRARSLKGFNALGELFDRLELGKIGMLQAAKRRKKASSK